MASQIAPPASFSLLLKFQGGRRRIIKKDSRRARINNGCLRVFAAQTSEGPKKAPPGVDTRIHWENEDEGWIGGGSKSQQPKQEENQQKDILGDKFSELLKNSTDSHYQ